MLLQRSENKNIVSILFNIILHVFMFFIFAWWGSAAFQKFLDEPTVTDITTTLGEDGYHLKFPQITICNYDFLKMNSELQKCTDGKNMYADTLKKCLHEKGDFLP